MRREIFGRRPTSYDLDIALNNLQPCSECWKIYLAEGALLSFQRKQPGLTKATASKLASGESEQIDFKRNPAGLTVDDLVAFANTKSGGEILLGVEEESNEDGSQYGVPVGCDLSDEVILQILNKAIAAIPPISVKLFAENTDANAIIRVVIPSSDSRPHCTPKGVYLRRDGSRNRPLHPPELLGIFLESESRAFAKRFETAAETITGQIFELQQSLSSSVEDMAGKLGWVDSQLGNTENAMNTAAAYAKLSHEEAGYISDRLRALFRQDEREDPVQKKTRDEFLESIVKQLNDDPRLIEAAKSGANALQIRAEGRAATELTKDDHLCGGF